MSNPRSYKLAGIALVLSLVFASRAIAADAVTDAMQSAYAPYRAALFKTNNGTQAEAQQVMQQAQAAWTQLVALHSAKPGAPYDRDAGFAPALNEVSQVYAKAAEEIGKNQLPQAHDTLEHARDVMAALRRRNQVIVYSDHMNAYHEKMETLLNDGPKMLDQPQGLLLMTAEVGALDFLARRLTTEAQLGVAKNEEFQVLVNAVVQSVIDLKAALLAQDRAAVKQAMGKIKGPYSKLFMKFG